MRRIISLILLFLCGLHLNGQITLKAEYPLENIQYFYISDTNGVFVNYSIYSSSDSILLFDDRHQFIRTVIPPDDSILSIINVSKYLYNADELIELVYVCQEFKEGLRHYHTIIIDENSQLLERFNDQFMWMMPTAEGVKLISQGGVKIYDLPGIHYPVFKGEKGEQGVRGKQGLAGKQGIQGEKGVPGETGDKGESGELIIISDCNCPENMQRKPIIESLYLSEPFPNPSIGSSSIDYNISSGISDVVDVPASFLVFYDITGIERMRLLLQPSAGSIEIGRSLLGAGTFLFRIENKDGTSETRKLIFL